jgi:hypothetical protein
MPVFRPGKLHLAGKLRVLRIAKGHSVNLCLPSIIEECVIIGSPIENIPHTQAKQILIAASLFFAGRISPG